MGVSQVSPPPTIQDCKDVIWQYSNISAYLSYFMKIKKMTRVELADRVKISPRSFYRKMENSSFSSLELMRILNALDAPKN